MRSCCLGDRVDNPRRNLRRNRRETPVVPRLCRLLLWRLREGHVLGFDSVPQRQTIAPLPAVAGCPLKVGLT